MSNQEEQLQEPTPDQTISEQQETSTQQEIEQLKTELEESKDKYLRLFAEFDNFKKRTVKERFELMKTAIHATFRSSSKLRPFDHDFTHNNNSREIRGNGPNGICLLRKLRYLFRSSTCRNVACL